MRNCIIFLIINCTFLMRAQAPSRFYSAYGGAGEDLGRDCIQCMDGNYLIAGSSSSSGQGQSDFYLLKIDTMGQRIWDSYLGGFGIDIGNAITELPDSGFVITGYSNSYGTGGYDFLTIRVDKFGNEVWKRTYGGADWDFAKDVVYTPDSCIVVVGCQRDVSINKLDGIVLKYDMHGNLLWTKRLGGVEDEEINSIIVTKDSNLALIGYTNSVHDLHGDYFFCKMNLDSDTLFTLNFGNPGKSIGKDLLQRPTNEYVLVGSETYTNNPNTVSYIREISSTGQLNWEVNFYASDGDEEWVSVAQTKAGIGSSSFMRNVPVPGFRQQGNIFLHQNFGMFPNIVNSFGGAENEELYKHTGTKDGGFICVGSTNSYNGPDNDIFFIKLDSTIINYTSIVGYYEESIPKKVSPYKLSQKSNTVYLEFNDKERPEQLTLYSLQGVKLQEVKRPASNCSMSLENYSSGVYILRIATISGKVFSEKILTSN